MQRRNSGFRLHVDFSKTARSENWPQKPGLFFGTNVRRSRVRAFLLQLNAGKPKSIRCVAMAAFLYRCPNTGQHVQGWSAEEVRADETSYETVTCIACQQVHLVNPATGHVLTGDDDQ
jgi:hypothetical protein